MATRKATMLSCDNPSCEVEYESYEGDPAEGYYIDRGHWRSGGGRGPIPKVYACSIECFAPAVEARVLELG